MWPRAVLAVALRGPGKALLLASAAGWIALAWLLAGDRLPYSAEAMNHGEHAAASTATRLFHASGYFTAMWLAMILAMAPPLLLREIGRLWRTSLHRLRHVTIAWFLCGYVGIWLLAGVVLAMLSGWVSVSSERITTAIALVALWHCSPARQRCLNACHRVPSLARVRNRSPVGFAALWGLNRLVLRRDLRSRYAPGPARKGLSPHRHGPRRGRGYSRAAFAREAPWLAASHRPRPITGVALYACRDPKCRYRLALAALFHLPVVSAFRRTR